MLHGSPRDASDGASEAPVYRRILAELRERIASGAYPVGGPLPTDSELTEEFGVSRHSVRAAVHYLVTDRLVERHRGRGSVVVAKPGADDAWAVSSLEDVMAHSFRDALSVIGISRAGAAEAAPVAEALHRDAGTPLMRIDAQRLRDGAPYTFSRIYLPLDLAERLPISALGNPGNVPIVRLVEEHGGVSAERARQVVTAVASEGEVAERLGLPHGAPGLLLQRTWFTADGAGIEHAKIYCHPDRYQQVVDFHRARTVAPVARPMRSEASG